MSRPENLVPRVYSREFLPPVGLSACFRGEWVTVVRSKVSPGALCDTLVRRVNATLVWIAARELWVAP